MNPQLQHRIDRLADNEVSSQELTKLLAEIERENAWKQCALTLIEAAELKKTLRQMMQVQPVTVSGAKPERSRLFSTVIVACLLGIAFLAGRGLTPGSRPQVAVTEQPSTDKDSPISAAPETIEQPDPADDDQSAVAAGEISFEPESADRGSEIRKTSPEVVGFAQVLRHSGASPRYPVIAGEFSDRELMELTSIPEHIQRRARSNGIEMERLPRVLTVQLADGQRLAVPMDALGLRQTRAEVL